MPLLFVIPACASATETTDSAEITAATASTSADAAITYQLAWDNSAVMSNEESITFITNMDYTVTLTEGWVNNATVQLIPCADSSLLGWLLPGTAYAGHGDEESDPSRLLLAHIESLVDLPESTAGSVPLENTLYCEAHYLLGQSINGEELGPTLELSGTWQSAESETPTPFTISTDLAWGSIIELTAADGAPTTVGFESVTVTLQRDLLTVFDNLVFESADADDIAMNILRELTGNTVAIVD